jgi:hypothetical protein
VAWRGYVVDNIHQDLVVGSSRVHQCNLSELTVSEHLLTRQVLSPCVRINREISCGSSFDPNLECRAKSQIGKRLICHQIVGSCDWRRTDDALLAKPR